jgi:hypothetical protein
MAIKGLDIGPLLPVSGVRPGLRHAYNALAGGREHSMGTDETTQTRPQKVQCVADIEEVLAEARAIYRRSIKLTAAARGMTEVIGDGLPGWTDAENHQLLTVVERLEQTERILELRIQRLQKELEKEIMVALFYSKAELSEVLGKEEQEEKWSSTSRS